MTQNTENKVHDTKNFKVSEFACKHCGENHIKQVVIDMCQTIRDAIGLPIRINSGYRCPVHNSRVSKTPNSYHTQGLAADLYCKCGSEKLHKVIMQLEREGKLPDLRWNKRYIKKNFNHIDSGKVRNNKFCEGD